MIAPLIVVPLVLAIAVCLLITAVRTLIKVAKREVDFNRLLAFASVLLLTFLSFKIPLPTFVDGPAVTPEEEIDAHQLISFARAVGERDTVAELTDLRNVPDKFSRILALSDANPAIRVADDAVYVNWSSTPVGELAVAIAKEKNFSISIDYAPPRHTRKVYDQVWVFKPR